MFKLKNYCMYLLIIVIGMSLKAQQNPNYTQYMYNTIAINPAYAGSSDSFSAVSVYRSQWVGFDGSPETINLSLDSPVTEKMGLGVNIIKDALGPSEELNIDGNFSYNIQLDRELKIAFGLKAGARLLNVDFTKGEFQNQGDPLLNSNVDNQILATLGAGIFLYKYNWYIGLSAPNFFNQKYYDNVNEALVSDKFHNYLTAGYVFSLNDKLKFKPAILIDYVNGAPLRTNISANMLFSEKLTLGASYQVDAAVSALAGFQISNNIFIGYSFDYNTTQFSNYNDGTHEIILKFLLTKKRGMSFSPRFF